jgi:hypothetical protein
MGARALVETTADSIAPSMGPCGGTCGPPLGLGAAAMDGGHRLLLHIHILLLNPIPPVLTFWRRHKFHLRRQMPSNWLALAATGCLTSGVARGASDNEWMNGLIDWSYQYMGGFNCAQVNFGLHKRMST